MKALDYFDKINEYGINVDGVGRIHSPFLSDISRYGYTQYHYSLLIFMYTPDKYYADLSKAMNGDNPWELLSNNQKNELTMFDILTQTTSGIEDLMSSLSFFICGEIEWDNDRSAFLINKAKDKNGRDIVDGVINKNNYELVADICLQLANINVEERPTKMKFKSEKDRVFYEKFMKKKSEKNANKKSDPDFELPNMISVICTFHNSLNYSNVFNLTVYQVHDTFMRLIRERNTSIQDMSHAVWGGKYEQKWLERMDKQNNS